MKLKQKLRFLMPDFLEYIIYSKNRNPFWGELPKYIMQYLATAWEIKIIFHIF